MTHIENIPHILQFGITHKNSPNANPAFVTIGDKSLIDTRSTRSVKVDHGEYVSNIVLGDFIPFYFGVKMPMLFVIQKGGNFVEKATPPENIVYLVCSVSDIIQSSLIYYFSDGHATAADGFTKFYDRSRINELPSLIKWQSVTAAYWGGDENLDVKREKQAEFLVSGDLSPDFLIGFGCYNEDARQKLMDMGVDEGKIKIIPKAYY